MQNENKFNFFILNRCEDQSASDFVELSNFMTTDRKFSRYCGQVIIFTNTHRASSKMLPV